MLMFRPGPASCESLRVAGDPHAIFQHNNATGGWSSRTDTNNPVLNVRIFDTYNIIDASHGVALADNPSYRVALALTQTTPQKANTFFETDFLNELGESVANIYANRKVKVSQTMLISVDWDRLGAVYMAPTGFKTTLFYYLSDLGGDNISGFEGELSYPVSDSVRIGVKGKADISKRSALDRDWKSFAFVTYAFGSEKWTRLISR